ncbi:MAG: response regulator [Gammaproteobacteria bacterium]|nr:response regulator [Gammaproteobacteria bacterium]
MRTLTTGEVAKYCSVNFRTVIRWIERGYLRAHKLPGRGDNRVMLDDFLAFLEEQGLPVPREFGARNAKVLVVDDDLNMAAAIQRTLNLAGFQTLVATDGFRAGTLLTQFLPAIMTLDLQMPGVGGMDVLKFVRETPLLAPTKVLIVSAMPAKKLQAAIKAGADDVLPKPFEDEALVNCVSSLLPSAGLQQTGVNSGR